MGHSSNTNMPDCGIVIELLEGLELRTAREWRFDEQNAIKIGRSRDSDVCLSHPNISRCHVVVFFEDGHWNISSIGANGTYVDGEQIDHFQLPEKGSLTLRLSKEGPLLDISRMSEDDSSMGDVTRWIGRLQSGDDDAAAEKIYETYFNRIVNLARRRLDGRTRRVTDEEDVAMAVLHSLFRGISDGRYPELSSRDGLWRLLVVMTARRAINDVQAQRAQKRGHGQVRGESVFIRADADSNQGIDQFAVEAESPEFVERLSEQLQKTLEDLGDETIRKVVMFKLEGFTNAEIAEKLNVTERTVERKIARLREVCQKTQTD